MLRPDRTCAREKGAPRLQIVGAGSGHCPDFAIMTQDDKKSAYWTGALVGALVIVIAILWAAGVFQPGAMPTQ